MYCKTCGAKMNDNAAVCVKCGCKKFVGNHFCPVCGSRTSEDQKICTKCQSKLVTFPSLHEMKKTKTHKGPSKMRKTIGTIFLVLGIIFVIAFVFLCVDTIMNPSYFEIPGAIPTLGGLFWGIGIWLPVHFRLCSCVPLSVYYYSIMIAICKMVFCIKIALYFGYFAYCYHYVYGCIIFFKGVKAVGGKNSYESIKRYQDKTYDKILVRIPKGQKDIIQEHAQAKGESVNGFICRAISETMERDKVAPATDDEQ